MMHLFEKDGRLQFTDIQDEFVDALVPLMEKQGFKLVDTGPLVAARQEYESGTALAIAAEINGVVEKELLSYLEDNGVTIHNDV